jgi:hypothetical protein
LKDLDYNFGTIMRSAPRALTLLAAILLAACAGDSSGPSLGDLHYEFALYGHCGAAGCDSTYTAVQPGDTLGFWLLIQDDTPDTAALPRVRPGCALNLVIQRTGTFDSEVDVPAAPTCPDSLEIGGDNWPGSLTTNRIYTFRVPDGLPSGTYQVNSKVLQSPRVDRAVRFTIP